MSQVRNYRLMAKGYWLMALCSFLLIGCENADPFVNPGKVENPNWEETVENNISSSMTVIVKVSFTEQEGVLAVFMGDVCCEVGTYIDGLYHLYITPATEEGGEVQIRFYSPELKRVFVAKEPLIYHNNDHIGTISAPYTPEWQVAD